MMFDPNLLLSQNELTIPRTPAELAHWVDDKCRQFASCPEAKEWVLLHKGLSKKFHEEVYPFSLFATHVYGGRSDIRCIPNLDNRDFDAVILDRSTSPPLELKVEISSAIEGYEEHLRMIYFVRHGSVNTWGTLLASGTKNTGHTIQVKDEMIAHSELLAHTLSLISAAAKRKSSTPDRSGKYGRGHILVLVFDDCHWFKLEQDAAALKTFVQKDVLTFPLDFADLYMVGLSGKTFLHFGLSEVKNS